jgi:hypothetical protein
MSFREVTQSIERMLEERLGSGSRTSWPTVDDEVDGDGEHKLQVNGEIYFASREPLDSDVELQIVVLNAKGQVVATQSFSVMKEDFLGYEAFSMPIYCKAFTRRGLDDCRSGKRIR